eukprot:364227-Chlamydomonas_euryale.AAC.10
MCRRALAHARIDIICLPTRQTAAVTNASVETRLARCAHSMSAERLPMGCRRPATAPATLRACRAVSYIPAAIPRLPMLST